MSMLDNKKKMRHIYYMDRKWCFQRKWNIHVIGRGRDMGHPKPGFGAQGFGAL